MPEPKIANVSFNHIKSPEIRHNQNHNSDVQSVQAPGLVKNDSFSSFKPSKSALGINFDSRNARKTENGHLVSPLLDDSMFQPISRSNTFDFYKNSNSSDSSLTNGVGNNLSSSISNLTFSPLGTSRTNISELLASPKEHTTPLQKSRLFGSKKSNRDSVLTKRRSSTASESLPRSNTKTITLSSSKKILSEISSLKPRAPELTGSTLLRRKSSDSRKTPILNDDNASTKFHHHNHHLKLKSRRDSTPVFSSSSSNSRVISDAPAMFNFHPTAGISPTSEVLRVVASIENAMSVNKNLPEAKKIEYSDRLIYLLQSCVLPLFKGEVLATPIEDLNKVVETYLKLRINYTDVEKEVESNPEGAGEVSTISDCKAIINEFEDFIRVGIQLMENQSHYDSELNKMTRLTKFNSSSRLSSVSTNDSRGTNGTSVYEIESKVAALWDFFLHDILSYLEAIFLPLQMEFEGCGLVLTNPSSAASFWSKLLVPAEDLKVKRYILLVFRDSVIIPMVEKLDNVNNFLAGCESDDMYLQKLCLLQCFGILSTAQSNDYNQKVVESLLDIMKRDIKI